jgi:predicted transposase YbfD/YdcC
MKKSIIEIFNEGLTDHRKGNAIEHKLIDVVVIGILTVLTGGKGFTDMASFGQAKLEWLKTFLELPNGIPSHDVFGDIFAKLDSTEFHKCFSEWVNCLVDSLESQVVALDGKTARRTRDVQSGKKALHVVSAWASQNSMVLGQIAVDEKSNEITAIPKLLETLAIKGCIISIDAMGTQKSIATKIINKEADYILSLKDNQKNLCEAVSLYLKEDIMTKDKKELKNKEQYCKTVEKSHGRIETRECYICEDIEWLEQKNDWSGLSGIGVIVSTREIGGVLSTEYNYFIYSMKGVTAEKVLFYKRSHWSIENSLHWVMDMSFREDESRIRTGNAAENLNVLIHMAINLLKAEKTSKRGISGKMYECALNVEYLKKVINCTETI